MSDMQEGWCGWCTEATTEHRVRWGWEDSRGPTQGTILRAAMEHSEKASQLACYAHYGVHGRWKRRWASRCSVEPRALLQAWAVEMTCSLHAPCLWSLSCLLQVLPRAFLSPDTFISVLLSPLLKILAGSINSAPEKHRDSSVFITNGAAGGGNNSYLLLRKGFENITGLFSPTLQRPEE